MRSDIKHQNQIGESKRINIIKTSMNNKDNNCDGSNTIILLSHATKDTICLCIDIARTLFDINVNKINKDGKDGKDHEYSGDNNGEQINDKSVLQINLDLNLLNDITSSIKDLMINIKNVKKNLHFINDLRNTTNDLELSLLRDTKTFENTVNNIYNNLFKPIGITINESLSDNNNDVIVQAENKDILRKICNNKMNSRLLDANVSASSSVASTKKVMKIQKKNDVQKFTLLSKSQYDTDEKIRQFKFQMSPHRNDIVDINKIIKYIMGMLKIKISSNELKNKIYMLSPNSFEKANIELYMMINDTSKLFLNMFQKKESCFFIKTFDFEGNITTNNKILLINVSFNDIKTEINLIINNVISLGKKFST